MRNNFLDALQSQPCNHSLFGQMNNHIVLQPFDIYNIIEVYLYIPAVGLDNYMVSHTYCRFSGRN